MRRFLAQTADTLATRTSHQLGPIGRDDNDDAAFGQKLFALIRDLFWTTTTTATGGELSQGGAGCGVKRAPQSGSMSSARAIAEDVDIAIDSAEGWEFAFEGGAHILFRHIRKDVRFVSSSASLSSPLSPLSLLSFLISSSFTAIELTLKDGKLLRLAKRNKHTLPTLEKYRAFNDDFLPLLTPDNGEHLLVATTLVKITSDVIHTLQSEQVAPNTKRASILNEDDTHGTLLEDLSADPSVLLLDFKVLISPLDDIHLFSGMC
jgi:hypothetical protein